MLEYDGTSYRGFQVQRATPTVQGKLEEALRSILSAPVRIQGASRTDAGAHARGQVAAFSTEAAYTPGVFQRALNATLPADIRVRETLEVDPVFDPRRCAVSRVYRYVILNRPAASALWSRFAHQVARTLDVEAMREAAQALVGQHDFRAFCGRTMHRDRRAVRRILRAEVERRGSTVVTELEGDAFLPNQVRRIVGTLVRVGLGKLDGSAVHTLLEDPDSTSAAAALPARGLYLERVVYPDGRLTRAWRGDGAAPARESEGVSWRS